MKAEHAETWVVAAVCLLATVITALDVFVWRAA